MRNDSYPSLLERLRRENIIDEDHADTLVRALPAPWWLTTLQAIAAWIASLIIMSTFFAPLLMLGDGPVARAVGGALLAGAALALFGRGTSFTAQMALAFSLAGQALLVSAVAGGFGALINGSTSISIAGIAVAAAMLVPRSSVVHRTACAIIALTHAGMLIGPGNALALFAVVLTGAAVALWLTRSLWATRDQADLIKAFAHATSLAALIAAWFVGVEHGRGIFARLGDTYPSHLPALYPTGVAIILLAACLWLTRTAPTTVRVVTVGGTLAFTLAAAQAPALVVCTAIAVAAFHACHRPWVALALLAALLYLGEFYYNLQTTLLIKSMVLGTTGLVLLVLRMLVLRWQRSFS